MPAAGRAGLASPAATAPTDRLVVMHYHLRPGGVTTVIRDGLSALLGSGYGERLRELVVIAGGTGRNRTGRTDHDALRKALESARSKKQRSAVLVSVVVEPGLGYRRRSGGADQERLMRSLTERYGDAVWWVHNYHLGKNTALTGAVIRAAAAGQSILLQIHDFPECGRPDNLRRVLRDCGAQRYPRTPNTHYLTINRRDRSLLLRAGLPETAVSLLPNPVASPAASPAPPGSAEAIDARRRLADAQHHAWWTGQVATELPIWLYPVRARRRKNVLEAALLAGLADANLVVTLPALSAAERRYGRRLSQLYESGAVRGAYGIGDMPADARLSFDDLVRAADVVVSTSIEEGFGYAYVGAVQWGRPLVARRLHVADDIGAVLELGRCLLYDRLIAPITASELRVVQRAYRRVGAAVVPDTAAVDFAQLPQSLQWVVLRRAEQPAYRRELAMANSQLLEDVHSVADRSLAAAAASQSAAAASQSAATAIEATLGPAAFAAAASRVLDSMRQGSRGTDAGAPRRTTVDVERAVEAGFDTVETARMLVAR